MTSRQQGGVAPPEPRRLVRVGGSALERFASWFNSLVGSVDYRQSNQWKMGLASSRSFSNGAKPGAVMLSGACSCQLHQLNITVPHIENAACCSGGQRS